jgi:hypothetical protein
MAQRAGFGLVQADYDNYAQLFHTGREPDLSPTGSDRWRALYRNHRWADFAAGSEFREPMLAAQTLVGIYLISHVDHQLDYQIENIIRGRSILSATLAERITLDRIALYMQQRRQTDSRFNDMLSGAPIEFHSQEEIDRMQRLGRDIDMITRRRMVPGRGISESARGEMRSVQNLFRHGEQGWAPAYRFMEEKFLILNTLEQEFIFNWCEERRAARLAELAGSDDVLIEARRRVANRVAADRIREDTTIVDTVAVFDEDGNIVAARQREHDLGAVGYTDAEIGRMHANTPQIVAMERLRMEEARHSAYKYVVGVYRSSDYHLETLQRIHRYFLNAARQGDPIAQYHLALFLWHLGNIVDPHTGIAEHRYRSEEWLRRAETSDVTRSRVEELREQFETERRTAVGRQETMDRRIEALARVEWDKIDMIDEVLIGIARRIGRVGGGRTGSQETGNFTGAGGQYQD